MILVIGYGNDLRGDDGAGAHVASVIASKRLPNVDVRSVHQLTPELAEPISRAELVVFIDARIAEFGEGVRVERLERRAATMEHVASPAALLELADAVFDGRPEAWLVSIPAIDFNFGAPFSPTTYAAIGKAVGDVIRLIEGHLKCTKSA